MTSSLVGSEMCIRDSPPSSHAAAPVAFKSMRSSRMSMTPACSCMCCATVSYTHLTLPTICSV
eukprot:1801507-Prorocentrum_lima.AAC.1